MARKKKSEKLRGAKRMKENGMRLVSVWLDRSEAQVIEEAAALVGKKLATFVREAAFGSAGVVLDARDNHQEPNAEFWEKMIGDPLTAN